MDGEINWVDEPRAACINTSSMNSWFRWNLASARVLVEIISFSKLTSAGTNKKSEVRTHLFLHPHLGACWVFARESTIQLHRFCDLWRRRNTQCSCYLSPSVPSPERSASQVLPSVGSAGPTLTVSLLDLGIPFQLVGECLAVQVVEVAHDPGEGDVVG